LLLDKLYLCLSGSQFLRIGTLVFSVPPFAVCARDSDHLRLLDFCPWKLTSDLYLLPDGIENRLHIAKVESSYQEVSVFFSFSLLPRQKKAVVAYKQ
jgi:hypothetical protein